VTVSHRHADFLSIILLGVVQTVTDTAESMLRAAVVERMMIRLKKRKRRGARSKSQQQQQVPWRPHIIIFASLSFSLLLGVSLTAASSPSERTDSHTKTERRIAMEQCANA
jgi:hypothetical protein